MSKINDVFFEINKLNRFNRLEPNLLKKQNDPGELLKNCIYLEDSMIELFGIKIYGSPWYFS